LTLSIFWKNNHLFYLTVDDSTLLSTVEKDKRIEQAFNEFNDSWLTYWNVYIDLQNMLYESLKLARDVAWLGATTPEKVSSINAAQRQLFATMPRRLDYAPLGQVNRSMDDALPKIDELQRTLLSEKEKCKSLENAIDVLLEKSNKTKQELK
jgi:hypothetical protein